MSNFLERFQICDLSSSKIQTVVFGIVVLSIDFRLELLLTHGTRKLQVVHMLSLNVLLHIALFGLVAASQAEVNASLKMLEVRVQGRIGLSFGLQIRV